MESTPAPETPDLQEQITVNQASTSTNLAPQLKKLFGFAAGLFLLLIAAFAAYSYFTQYFSGQDPSTEQTAVTTPENILSANWENFTVEIDQQALSPSDSYQFVLDPSSADAYIPDTYELIDSIQLKLVDQESGEHAKEINQPITLTYQYYSIDLPSCNYDENSLTAFFYDPKKDDLRSIRTDLDKSNKVLTAKLLDLYPKDNGFTELLIMVNASNFIKGCGKDASAYLQGGKLVTQSAGYTIQLPDPEQRPRIIGPGDLTALIPLPSSFPDDFIFVINAAIDTNDLKPGSYDTVQYGYEGMPFTPYSTDRENVVQKYVIELSGQLALYLSTSSENYSRHYIFIKNPHPTSSGGKYLYIFTLQVGPYSNDYAVDNAISRIRSTVDQMEFLDTFK